MSKPRLTLILSALLCASLAHGEEPFKQIGSILEDKCSGCHSGDEPEGDLDITRLNPDLLQGPDAEHWHEVLNQINEGQMPPADEEQLTTNELEQVTKWLESALSQAAERRMQTGGRQVMRRLNRYEYQNTLQDLLGIALDYRAHIPSDLAGEDGILTNGYFLGTSTVQIQSYLDVAERAVAEAMPLKAVDVRNETQTKFADERPKKSRKKKTPAIKGLPKNTLLPDSDVFKKVIFDERPFAGRFRIRVKLKASASSDGRQPELTVLIGHRSSGDYIPKKVMGQQLVQHSPKEQTVTFTGNIEDFPLGKKNAYYNGSGSHNVTHMAVWLCNSVPRKSQFNSKSKLADIDEPLIELVSVELEGPLLGGYPSDVARNLIQGNPSDTPRERAEATLRRFLYRAYRRDVREDELAASMASFDEFYSITQDLRLALRKTFAMTLISPQFLYLVEPAEQSTEARRLTGYELATRLSYFLWASMPDDELLTLAASGELLEPTVLKAQVERMRRDEKFSRFTHQFASQWLGLNKIDNVAVNPTAHPTFSDELKEGLRQETLAFVDHVFANDLSCKNFIRSDFALLNRQLAEHYGIPNVNGSQLQTVALAPNSHRGGLLTQGSFMLRGSDGTDTNPIYRGVWLESRLFAKRLPPPPPGVPALEESQGNKQASIKEQLALHRKRPACARCHNRIDPWGYPFENFDATGAWRTQVDKLKVDASSELPDQTTVNGIEELQTYLLKHRSEDLAVALSRRVLAYAVGRPLDYSDETVVRRLAAEFKQSQFRISTLLQNVVTTRAFLQK